MDSTDLEWLRAVSERGSLSAAAKARGVSVSTASRRLDALEAVLGLRLVDRGARGVRLTREGSRIVALAQPALDAISAVGRAAAAMRVAGERHTVRVSATEFVVAEILAPHAVQLRAAAPNVTLELVGEATLVSLAEREADVAIRLTRPVGNSLHAQALPPTELRVYGAAALHDQAALEPGAPLPLLTYDDSYGRLPEHGWVDAIGRASIVVLRSSSTRALLQAAQAGLGAALLPVAFAHRAGLTEIASLPAPISRTPWITVHRDLRALPHVRATTRWIRQAFEAIARKPSC